ncbi:MAG TPA: helix-turn-helix domain-containing protein [Symbiobacteriaceae bacterium]|nr:helix-turn-helix domain-containing protein [Symbiobacteriaceae bacterium]
MSKTNSVEPMLLTVPEVALALRIARSRAYELVAQGVFPSVKIGKSVRVPRISLQTWVDLNTTVREEAQSM